LLMKTDFLCLVECFHECQNSLEKCLDDDGREK